MPRRAARTPWGPRGGAAEGESPRGGYCRGCGRAPSDYRRAGVTLNVTLNHRERAFSGIQPTGAAHLGNYLGAIRGWIAQQEESDAFYCIVDLHALTLPWDPVKLSEETLSKAAELIACGIDPGRSTLFVQSHVSGHAELAWILNCIARFGELRRMVQFKEKSRGESESVGVGLFTYPVLQAADVLLYRARWVPVGEDQRQHIELMRDIALRFNALFGDTFVVPEAKIPPAGARIMALDDPTEKMSKSAARPASSISLIDPPEAIVKKIRSAVTDSGREVRAAPDKPAITNLLTIFALMEEVPVADLERRFRSSGYGDLKKQLAEALSERLRPIRERYRELTADPAETQRLLSHGAQKAAEVAAATMEDVRARVGLLAP